MRYTGPVRFSHHGDEEVARQYNVIARNLIGMLAAASQQPFSTRSVILSNGVRITVEIIAQPVGPDRNWAEDAVSMMWSGQYQVSAHIYAPPGAVKDLGDIEKVYQYQFVYTGGAGEKWQVFEGEYLPHAGGSAVGAVFVVRENGVEHAAFPLVSTLKEPPEENPDAWLYLEDIVTDQQIAQWEGSLVVPRYEVAHASSQHLLQPNEDNIVHSPWMPKGVRHYLAEAYTPATVRQSGTLNMSVDESNSPPIVFPTDFPVFATSATDVGYEATLERFKRPEREGRYLEEIELGSSEHSAPDTDWYMSYGVYEAEFDGEPRFFGVAIDSAQKVYAWPLEAAGTETPDPAYVAQSIKTNVHAQFVKSQALQFPAGIYTNAPSYRDLFSNFEDVDAFQDGTYKDTSRYGWMPSPDGTKYVSVVEKHVEISELRHESSGPISGAEPVFFDNERDYRVADPQVAKFEITINPFGLYLGDFTLDVTPVEIVDQLDSFYPVQAEFAQEGAFEDVELGDLLVAGFEVRRLEETVDDWQLVQYLAGEASFPYGSWFPDPSLFLNCNAIDIAGLPAPLTATWKYNNSGPGDGFAHYEYRMPPYMTQDYPFTRVGNFDTDSIAQSLVAPYKSSFVLEGRFVVRNEDAEDKEVFSKCCRKFKENEYDFPNFFTAKVCSLNLATGTIVFGLCDSETSITSVEFQVGSHNNGAGAWGNWYPHTGTNKAEKTHAVFHKGRLIDHNSFDLVAQLDTELESFVLDKRLSFWGTLRPAATSVIPPVSSEQYGFSAGAFNTQYVGHMLTDLGLNPVDVAQGRYGVRDFPWGLEMYGWFAQNHFSANSSQEVLSGEDFVVYTGVYIDMVDPVSIQPMSNEVVGVPDVQPVHVDIIALREARFTHAELYEEAFDEEADTGFNFALRNEKRSPVDEGTGEDLGYPYRRTDGPSSEPETWGSELIYAPLAMFSDGSEGVRASNLLMPHARVYCDVGKSVNPIWYRFPAEKIGALRDQGVEDSPFVAKAYGLVEIADGD